MKNKSFTIKIRHPELDSGSHKHSLFGLPRRNFISPRNDAKCAFTLAEVLITLAVIGVVAAMTIPTMVANYQKTQYVTQLKKVYTELSRAIKQMMVDEGVEKVSATDILTHDGVEDYDTALQRAGNQFLKKYFKVIKDCGSVYPSTCFADDSKSIDSSFVGNPSCSGYSVIIASGAGICINLAGTKPGKIVVDINGLNKPNISGRDIFAFSFYYDGSLDSVTPECRKGIPNKTTITCSGHNTAEELREFRYTTNFSGDPCISSYYGEGCFDKILNDNWKMDY